MKEVKGEWGQGFQAGVSMTAMRTAPLFGDRKTRSGLWPFPGSNLHVPPKGLCFSPRADRKPEGNGGRPGSFGAGI